MQINSKDKKAVKAGFWYTISNFVTKGATIITTPIFARILTKSELGACSNISSWILILVPLLSLDFYSSVKIARFEYKEDLDKYCASIAVYGSVFTLLFYILALLNIKWVCGFLLVNELQLHIIFWYILLYPALSIFQAKNNISFNYKLSTTISISSFFLSQFFSLLLVFLSNDKVTGRVLGTRGTYIVISAVIYVYLLVKGSGVSFKYLKYAVAVSFPLIWHTLSMHLLSSGDKVVITHFFGSDVTALYSVAYTCSHAISVLYHSMNNAWSTWALIQIDSNNYEKHKSVSRIYILLFFAALIGLLLISPEILMVVGGKKYLEAVKVMPPALIAVGAQMLYSLFINMETYKRKQKNIAIGTLGAATVNMILNLVFVPLFGYVAAAYTTLAGYSCLFLFHYFSVKKIGGEEYYDVKLMFGVLIVSIAAIPLVDILFVRTAVRYCAIGVYAIAALGIGYKYRKKLCLVKELLFKKAGG